MDEYEHGDYAEEGWLCVDEALRCKDRPCYNRTASKSLLGRFLLLRLHTNTVHGTLCHYMNVMSASVC